MHSVIFVSFYKIIRVKASTKHSNWLFFVLINYLRALVSRLISWNNEQKNPNSYIFPSQGLTRCFRALCEVISWFSSSSRRSKVNALRASNLNNEQRFQRKKNKIKKNFSEKCLHAASRQHEQVHVMPQMLYCSALN